MGNRANARWVEENGREKVKRVGFLFGRIVAFDNMLTAARRAARGKRRRPVVARFMADLEPNLFLLQQELTGGRWEPGPFHIFHIRDPKPRVISAAPFPDRVVHHAAMGVLDPIFDRCQIAASFACRVGKGTHRAVELVQRHSRRWRYYLKCDVEAFFETVNRGILKGLLRRKFKDRRLLELLDRIIDGPAATSEKGRGLPIGNLTSQYFANHYLSGLDHFVKQRLKVRGYLRYMDDFLLFGDDKGVLHRHRAAIRSFLAGELDLALKDRVTRLSPCSAGVPFLGFAVYPGLVRLQGSTARRMRKGIHWREKEFLSGSVGIEALSRSVRAAVAHASHGASLGLRRRWFFEPKMNAE